MSFDRALKTLSLGLLLFISNSPAAEPGWALDVSAARTEIQKGNYAAAESYLELAATMAREDQSVDSRLGAAYEALARRYRDDGQAGKAIAAFEGSIALYREAIDPAEPKLSSLLGALAALHEQREQYAAAEGARVAAIDVLESCYGASHPAVARGMEKLAGHYASRSDPDVADEYYQRALEVLRSAFGDRSPAVLPTLDAYERFLRQAGRGAEADRLDADRERISPKVYRMSDGVQAPKLVEKQEPEYSEEARELGIEGRVVMFVVVGEDGAPRNVWVMEPLGFGMDEKALEALSTWRFQPATKDGEPVAVASTVEMNFRLL